MCVPGRRRRGQTMRRGPSSSPWCRQRRRGPRCWPPSRHGPAVGDLRWQAPMLWTTRHETWVGVEGSRCHGDRGAQPSRREHDRVRRTPRASDPPAPSAASNGCDARTPTPLMTLGATSPPQLSRASPKVRWGERPHGSPGPSRPWPGRKAAWRPRSFVGGPWIFHAPTEEGCRCTRAKLWSARDSSRRSIC